MQFYYFFYFATTFIQRESMENENLPGDIQNFHKNTRWTTLKQRLTTFAS